MRIAVIVLVLLVLLGRVAGAQPKSEATQLFEQGRALVEKGKHAEACPLFDKSYALEPLPGTALNVADCREREGKLREAWRLFDQAAREYESANKLPQAKFARDRAAAIAPKLATVTVRVKDSSLPGLVVTVGGRDLPAGAEIVERVEPGNVDVTVTATGKQPFKTTTQAAAGQAAVVDVPPLADLTTAPSPPIVDQPARPTVASKRKPSRVYIAAGLGAGGVVALVVSGVVGLSAKSDYDEQFDRGACRDDGGRVVCDTEADATKVRAAGTRADRATAIGVVGGILVAAGAVVFFTAPRETIQVAPTASPTGGGISISGTF